MSSIAVDSAPRVTEVTSLTEAGRAAEVTAETIKRHIDRGSLQGVWIAGRRYVLRSDLDRFIRERRAVGRR